MLGYVLMRTVLDMTLSTPKAHFCVGETPQEIAWLWSETAIPGDGHHQSSYSPHTTITTVIMSLSYQSFFIHSNDELKDKTRNCGGHVF